MTRRGVRASKQGCVESDCFCVCQVAFLRHRCQGKRQLEWDPCSTGETQVMLTRTCRVRFGLRIRAAFLRHTSSGMCSAEQSHAVMMFAWSSPLQKIMEPPGMATRAIRWRRHEMSKGTIIEITCKFRRNVERNNRNCLDTHEISIEILVKS